jgi:hypothetical protein
MDLYNARKRKHNNRHNAQKKKKKNNAEPASTFPRHFWPLQEKKKRTEA